MRVAESVGVESTLKKQLINGFQLRKPIQMNPMKEEYLLSIITPFTNAGDSLEMKKLESAGATLFSEKNVNDEIHTNLLTKNARDNKYKIITSKYNVISNSIAKGLMNHGFIQISPKPADINEIMITNSWIGNSVLQCENAHDNNVNIMIGNSFSDINSIYNILKSSEACPNKPKESCKIAVVSSCSIFNTNAVCENPVTVSIQVIGEILKSRGIDVTFIKSKDVATMNTAEYDFILGPVSSTGQLKEDEMVAKGKELTDTTSFIDLASDMILFPCGVIADEDDGYGMLEYSDLLDREGLPISACLVATTKNTWNVPSLLHIVRDYESVTRWSSELFSPGTSRAQVKEDMDDARESFGIYFVRTLMKYLGKKQTN